MEFKQKSAETYMELAEISINIDGTSRKQHKHRWNSSRIQHKQMELAEISINIDGTQAEISINIDGTQQKSA